MMAQRYRQPNYRFSVHGKWHIVSDAWIDKQDKSVRDLWDRRVHAWQQCPGAFVLPHGAKRDDSDGNDGRAFLNDWTNTLLLLTAPSQCGKSYLGGVKTWLFTCPTHPQMPIFSHHGMKHREWSGPKEFIVASFTWDNVQIVWNTYRKIFPRTELREYSPNWGVFPGEVGKPKTLSFGTKAIQQVTLDSGSVLTFLCYSQSIKHWESRQADGGHMDEQCPEPHFDSLDARMRTRGEFEGGYTPIWTTLTGLVLDGRDDTGASGWMKTKIYDGKATKARTVKLYSIGMRDVPDAVISAATKKKEFDKLKEAIKNRDERAIRRMEATVLGGWESGGGLVIHPWNPLIHWISPFDYMKFKPTLYRLIDHGRDPCAALVFAKMPWGDMCVVKEYYVYDKGIKENAKGIVEDMCGNERRLLNEFFEPGDEPYYEEVQNNMEFYASEMDCRSFGKKTEESGSSIGSVYNQYGCECQPASGDHDKILIPLLQNAFIIDRFRKHINATLHEKGEREKPWTGELAELGGSCMYIFATCINTRSEIESHAINPKTGKPKSGQLDHAISCLKYATSKDRPYMGDWNEAQAANENIERCSETGY